MAKRREVFVFSDTAPFPFHAAKELVENIVHEMLSPKIEVCWPCAHEGWGDGGYTSSFHLGYKRGRRWCGIGTIDFSMRWVESRKKADKATDRYRIAEPYIAWCVDDDLFMGWSTRKPWAQGRCRKPSDAIRKVCLVILREPPQDARTEKTLRAIGVPLEYPEKRANTR